MKWREIEEEKKYESWNHLDTMLACYIIDHQSFGTSMK